MGRKKIEIKKIECATKRHMTFSKRSHGLIKKAKELSVLCEADVALVIISSAGKVQHFSTRPRIEQVIQQFNENIQEGNEAGMCSNEKECKVGCCGEYQLLESDISPLATQQNENAQIYWTSGIKPSSGMQSAPRHIPIMQQPQVLDAPHGREQVQILEIPFGEMEDPSSIQDKFGSSKVRGPDGASDYMQDQLVGEAGKLEQFSNQPSLQVSENVQVQVPKQHMQEGNGTGMSSDCMEELARLESFLLESEAEDPSLSLSAHGHITMHQPRVVEAPPQGREQVPMQGIDAASIQISVPGQFLSQEIRGPDGAPDYMQDAPVRGCEIPFSSGPRQSSSLWCLPEREAGKLEHFSNRPCLQVSSISPLYSMQSACGYIPTPQPQALIAPEGREQVQMPGVQGVPFGGIGEPCPIETYVPVASDYMQSPPVGGYEMPCYSGVQPSLFFWDQP